MRDRQRQNGIVGRKGFRLESGMLVYRADDIACDRANHGDRLPGGTMWHRQRSRFLPCIVHTISKAKISDNNPGHSPILKAER